MPNNCFENYSLNDLKIRRSSHPLNQYHQCNTTLELHNYLSFEQIVRTRHKIVVIFPMWVFAIFTKHENIFKSLSVRRRIKKSNPYHFSPIYSWVAPNMGTYPRTLKVRRWLPLLWSQGKWLSNMKAWVAPPSGQGGQPGDGARRSCRRHTGMVTNRNLFVDPLS